MFFFHNSHYFNTIPYLAKVFQKNRTIVKNSNKKVYLFGILLLGVVGIVFWLFMNIGKFNDNYNWREHYRGDSKDPYGVTVIRQLLGSYFPGHTFHQIKTKVSEALPLDKNQPASSYVFIGEAMYYDTADLRVLDEYLALGNTVFLSCKTIPIELMSYFYDPDECDSLAWDDISWFMADSVSLSLLHPSLSDQHHFDYWYDFQGKSQYHEWHFIDTTYFCGFYYDITSIGRVDNKVNFLKIAYDSGTVYLHTTPIAFSNYHLRRESGKDYAELILSHLPEGDIYWDGVSQVPESSGRSHNKSKSPPSGGWDDSPLAFMLSHPPLAWAWYLLLLLALIYLVFRAKRRQRILPVLPANTNTSKEFIENIGRLYYLEDNPRQLATLKFRLFLHDVREKYHLMVKEPDEAFIVDLARKSGVDHQLIRDIVKCHQGLPMEYDQHAALSKLHLLIESFYNYRDSRG